MRARGIVALAVVIGAALVTLFVASRASCGKTGPREGISATGSSTPQTEIAPIQVLVTKLIPQAGRVEYHYTVTNGSAFPVHTLVVGFDQYYGVPKLSGEPIGWDGDTIPSSSYQAPPGWNFEIQPTEEESLMAVKWVVSKKGRAIMGGESAGGFAVVLGQADQAYDNGGLWTAYVMGESPFWGALQPSGVTSVPISSIYAQSDLRVRPNPASGSIEIQFAMPTSGMAKVDIFDVAGRRVKRIVDERRAPGNSTASWDGRDNSGKRVASGTYFVRVKTPTTQRFARITWLPTSK